MNGWTSGPLLKTSRPLIRRKDGPMSTRDDTLLTLSGNDLTDGVSYPENFMMCV
jgi:hypothetical protein